MFFSKKSFLLRTVLKTLLISSTLMLKTFGQHPYDPARTEYINTQIDLRALDKKDTLRNNGTKILNSLLDFIYTVEDDDKNGYLNGKDAAKFYVKYRIKINDFLQIQISVTILKNPVSDGYQIKDWINCNSGSVLKILNTTDTSFEVHCWLRYNKILELAEFTSVGRIDPIRIYAPAKNIRNNLR